MLQHPLLPFKRIPVIVDDWVDPEFGTGACKVTPAHDFDDFNLGLRHSLPLDRTIWDEAGRFINNCGIPLLQVFSLVMGLNLHRERIDLKPDHR